uniref:NADH dehydrogenase subunit 4L n=1 Tax=Trachydiscus minutus TaxID=1032745 RepID=A0A140F2R2_9STRA|nr:NADH dehydrogenase subunit 4L [Trachydiscus minutus]AML60696.1 NADH dehydrogenase subunit 4L [Trachydiscus minutus]
MEQYLILSTILFFIGLFGIVLNRKNILVILMSIELMLLAINVNFIIFSNSIDDIIGQLFALLVLTVAAAESAIGLAILVIYYRLRGNIFIEQSHLMKG